MSTDGFLVLFRHLVSVIAREDPSHQLFLLATAPLGLALLIADPWHRPWRELLQGTKYSKCYASLEQGCFRDTATWARAGTTLFTQVHGTSCFLPEWDPVFRKSQRPPQRRREFHTTLDLSKTNLNTQTGHVNSNSNL